MPFRIDTPERRAALDPRDKPYFQRLGRGLHLGYRKGKTRASWVIRWREGTSYRSLTVEWGAPDDLIVERGVPSISYLEAVEIAMTEGTYYCSFCKKSSKEVEKLIAGPNAFICNECVHLCQIYIDNPQEKGTLKLDHNDKPALDNEGRPLFVEQP